MSDFDQYINDASDKYDVPVDRIRAHIETESNWDPDAVSPVGGDDAPVGLMQVRPSTAKWLGIDNPKDPRQNIEAGTKYIRYLNDRFDGDWDKTSAAYNFGPTNVAKGKAYPPETQKYVQKINDIVTPKDDEETFKPVDPPAESFAPIKAEESFTPLKESFAPLSSPKDNNTDGTFHMPIASQLVDQLVSVGEIPVGMAIRFKEMLAGDKSPEQIEDLVQQFKKDATLSGTIQRMTGMKDTGTEVSDAFAPAGQMLNRATQVSGSDIANLNPFTSLAGQDLNDTGLSQKPVLSPTGQGFAQDATQLLLARGGQKAVTDNIIEGSSRRLPDDSSTLPNPNPPTQPPQGPTSLNPAAQIAEQRTAEAQKTVALAQQSATDIANYNKSPETYGVDESTKVNPYGQGSNFGLPATMRFDPNHNYHTVTIDDVPPIAGLNQNTVALNTPDSFKMPPEADAYVSKILERGPEGVKTMDQALDAVTQFTDDPWQKELAQALQSPWMEDHKFTVFSLAKDVAPNYFGRTEIGPYGPQDVRFIVDLANKDMSGLSPSTVLHEASHIATHNALLIGNHIINQERMVGSDDPTVQSLKNMYPGEYEFATKLEALAHTVYPSLVQRIDGTWLQYWKTQFKRFQARLEAKDMNAPYNRRDILFPKSEMKYNENVNRGHEFLAWGLTDPYIRSIMKQLYINDNGRVWDATQTIPIHQKKLALKQQMMEPQSVWDKVVQHIASYIKLGPTSDSTLDRASQYKASQEKIRNFLEFMDTHKTASDVLDGIVMPILKANKSTNPNAPTEAVAAMMQSFKDNPSVRDMAAFRKFEGPSKDMLSKIVSPYKEWNQLFAIEGQKLYKYRDLNKLTGAFYPVSMVANIANNPVTSFVVTKFYDIAGDAHTIKKYMVQVVADFFKAPQDAQNRIVTALTQINRPETQAVLVNPRLHQYGADWWTKPNSLRLADSELSHYGMQNSDIPLYRNTLEPYFIALLKLDKVTIKTGFGRSLESKAIGYFPRSFGHGKFSIYGYEPGSGALVYYRRAKTWKEIRALEIDLQSKGFVTQKKISPDYTDFKGHLLGLIETKPDTSIAKMAQATLDAGERHRRSQEFERTANGVAGFVGQQINHPKELELLKMQIYQRLELTMEAYKASRLVDEITRPMRSDALISFYYPNAVHWANDLVRRELGGDISQLKLIDSGAQWILNTGHTLWLKAFHKDAHAIAPNEITLSTTAAKEIARYATAASSAYALSGNLPNLIVNGFTIPLVSILGGVPDSLMLNANPKQFMQALTTAHIRSIADATMLLSGHSTDTELRRFMTKALDQGLVASNAFNDLPQMKQTIEQTKLEKGLDWTLNLPRRFFNDPVETTTNYMSLLYYHRLVQILYPKMSVSDQFDVIRSLTKRYTGLYDRWNKALMWDYMGILGQGASNFSIWTGTRIAESYELTKNIITHKSYAPLVALMLTGIFVAGLQGMPGAQDYDNIRQWLSKDPKQKLVPIQVHLKPQDLEMKELGIPQWIRQGVAMNSLGVDMSSRGRWSGFFDLGGVTYTMPAKIMNIWSYFFGAVNERTGTPGDMARGNDVATTLDAISAMPPIAQGTMRQHAGTRNLRGDGSLSFLSSHGGAQYTQSAKDRPMGIPAEAWNYGNFKTMKQAEDQRDFYNKLYSDNEFKQKKIELKKHGLEQMIEALSARRSGDNSKADRLMTSARDNLAKLNKISPSDYRQFANELLGGIQKESDTTEEATIKQIMHSKDVGEIKVLLQTLTTIRQSRPSP